MDQGQQPSSGEGVFTHQTVSAQIMVTRALRHLGRSRALASRWTVVGV